MVGVHGVLTQLQERRGALLTGGRARAAAALSLAALAAACARTPTATPSRVADGRYAMGTLLEITLLGAPGAPPREALDACFALAADLEARFTTFDPDSELSRLNARTAGEAIRVSPPLVAILGDARRLAAETGGAFDVTVGPLLALWSRAAERGALPDAESLAAARAPVGAQHITITPDGRVRLLAGASVDLGGLAKGWALDRMAELLRRRGVTRGLLSFGGSSVLALGTPADADAWRVLVHGRGGSPVGVVALRDRHLSVSESLGRSRVVAGRRLGDVIDPRSGWPVGTERLAAVVADSGAQAEALSTALLVAAPDAVSDWSGSDRHYLLRDAQARARTSDGFLAATRFRPLPAAAP